LFKKPVFEGKEVKEVLKKNSECDVDFSNELFSSLDEQGRDLMSRMLCKDPAARVTAAEALDHPFLA
jgi:serine/threonine protein kinase